MKDLDFDELDRAVNSLMSDKTTPASGDTSSSVLQPSAPVTSSPVSPIPKTPAATSIPRSAPPAARRGGRFMDVVPAARKTKEPVSAPVSREGASLQPVTPEMTPIASKDQSTIEMPKVQADSASVAPVSTTDWPDPLELAASKAPTASVEKTPEVSEPLEPSIDNTVEPKSAPVVESPPKPTGPTSADEPLSSPFLPDAKVEKRPLGGAALTSTDSELMVEDENAQLPALPKDVEPALPEELHGDIASIEADNSTTDPSKHTQPPEETAAAKVPEVEAKKPAVTVTEATVPSGPTSIPQQYKEEPSSSDQKNGAIYDTDSYHQPLSHPAKKKHGWSWVLWILVILLIGAGGGAALYFLGIF